VKKKYDTKEEKHMVDFTNPIDIAVRTNAAIDEIINKVLDYYDKGI